jgi:hypothetical protein
MEVIEVELTSRTIVILIFKSSAFAILSWTGGKFFYSGIRNNYNIRTLLPRSYQQSEDF